MAKQATTKMARQIYIRILRSGIVRRSIYSGMLFGALIYIISEHLANKWIPESAAWYVWVAVGVGYIIVFKIMSHLIAPAYTWIEERRLDDGT
jgi:hypothetical protein